MNPELPRTPREELEASLTALLLGELPPDKAAALRGVIAHDPELAKLHERLKLTIDFIAETAASPAAEAADQPEPLLLAEQRRQKLLAHFKTVKPQEFQQPRKRRVPWLVPVAIAAAMVAIVSILLPTARKRFYLRETFGAAAPAAIRSEDASEAALSGLSHGSKHLPAASSSAPAKGDVISFGFSRRESEREMAQAADAAPPPPAARPKAATIALPPDAESISAGTVADSTAVAAVEYPRRYGGTAYGNGILQQKQSVQAQAKNKDEVNIANIGAVPVARPLESLAIQPPPTQQGLSLMGPRPSEDFFALGTTRNDSRSVALYTPSTDAGKFGDVSATLRGFYDDNVNGAASPEAQAAGQAPQPMFYRLLPGTGGGGGSQPASGPVYANGPQPGKPAAQANPSDLALDLREQVQPLAESAATLAPAPAAAVAKSAGEYKFVTGTVRDDLAPGQQLAKDLLTASTANELAGNLAIRAPAPAATPAPATGYADTSARWNFTTGKAESAGKPVELADLENGWGRAEGRAGIATTSPNSSVQLGFSGLTHDDVGGLRSLNRTEPGAVQGRLAADTPKAGAESTVPGGVDPATGLPVAADTYAITAPAPAVMAAPLESAPILAPATMAAGRDQIELAKSELPPREQDAFRRRYGLSMGATAEGKTKGLAPGIAAPPIPQSLEVRTFDVDPNALRDKLAQASGTTFGGGGGGGGGGFGGGGGMGGMGGGGSASRAQVAEAAQQDNLRLNGDASAEFRVARKLDFAKEQEKLDKVASGIGPATPAVSAGDTLGREVAKKEQADSFAGYLRNQSVGNAAVAGEKAPVLGDIPAAGRLFRSRSAAESETAARQKIELPALSADEPLATGQGFFFAANGAVTSGVNTWQDQDRDGTLNWFGPGAPPAAPVANAGSITTLGSGSRNTAPTELLDRNGLGSDRINQMRDSKPALSSETLGKLQYPENTEAVGPEKKRELQAGVGFGGGRESAKQTRQYQSTGTVGDAVFSIDPESHNLIVVADPATTAGISQIITDSAGTPHVAAKPLLAARRSLIELDGLNEAAKRPRTLAENSGRSQFTTNAIVSAAGRQDIARKLSQLHLNSVQYEGLPLSEVLRNLDDESKRQDPQQRGVNFILNREETDSSKLGEIAPATGLPAPASQPVDVGAVGVRINTPLKGASLKEILDAVVKSSDTPITYAIEDSGVVFSVATNKAALKTELDVAKKARPIAPAAEPQPEVQTSDNAFSTFSLNVSDVSFKLAGASLEKGQMPDAASVRSEEFINAFDYRDPEPAAGVPIAFAWERASYPYAQSRDLLRFSIKTAALGRQPGRPLNLVLLLDNSGSMERADRVSIIHEALRVLAAQLQPQDKFSVVTFARTARLWVDGVPGNQAGQAAEEMSKLTPQGGTNLEDAMNTAYATALRHYLANGVNRVVLLTDGAANLGDVEPADLKQKVESYRKQGVALDCFGIGWEGYNDDLLEELSRNGDGRYGFINTPEEAATEFAGQLAGALHVAASDVKVQVEFNPRRVRAYRQIGYAKHQLTKEQFRDNTVDAAELGAAEAGNALYVIDVNPGGEGPVATVRARYKVPGTSEYHEHEWAVPYHGNAVGLELATPAMRLAGAASAFSEWLVSSPYAGEVSPDSLLNYLRGVPEIWGADGRPKKLEWMIRQAKSIAGK